MFLLLPVVVIPVRFIPEVGLFLLRFISEMGLFLFYADKPATESSVAQGRLFPFVAQER